MMDTAMFEKIVLATVDKLKAIALSNPIVITSCKSGDDFELRVVDTVGNVLHELRIDAIIHHTPGSHSFPDIVIEFDLGLKYGIEVKSSSGSKSKGWKINGNSVMGSTRDPDVIETYIIFGKTAKTMLEFKARRYENCVANVVVTHSPRYLIDMELEDGETFFSKSKIDYTALTTSENPIGMITSYFQQQGQKAWWLSDNTPAAVRIFGELPEREQLELFGYGFAHFPELFQRNSKKYKRLAFWLATERSVVASSLRDDFSAGGQVDLVLNGHTYTKLPQIFKRLCDYREFLISSLNQAEPESLYSDWQQGVVPENNIHSKVNSWMAVAAGNISESQLPEGIEPIVLLKNIFPEYTN
jgi:hypothetical protein